MPLNRAQQLDGFVLDTRPLRAYNTDVPPGGGFPQTQSEAGAVRRSRFSMAKLVALPSVSGLALPVAAAGVVDSANTCRERVFLDCCAPVRQ